MEQSDLLLLLDSRLDLLLAYFEAAQVVEGKSAVRLIFLPQLRCQHSLLALTFVLSF